jgi:small subunit ribosomal protein S17
MGSGVRRTMAGVIVSDKMDKTVIVQIDRMIQHPVYKKYIRRRTKLKAHDEQNRCKIGDKVRICESRPLSRDKSWRVTEILSGSDKEA